MNNTFVDELLQRSQSYRNGGPSASHTADMLYEAAIRIKAMMMTHDDMDDDIECLRNTLGELLAMCERQADFNDDQDGLMLDRARRALNGEIL